MLLGPLGSGAVQQIMRVVNSLEGQKAIMMRLKITYACNGGQVSEMVEGKNFPQGL